MKAAAVRVPPEEEERVWGSSEDWSSAALHKVSWYLRTFSPWKRGDCWKQGIRMKASAMWLQPWLCSESSEKGGLESSAWCSWERNQALLTWARWEIRGCFFLKKMLLWKSGVLINLSTNGSQMRSTSAPGTDAALIGNFKWWVSLRGPVLALRAPRLVWDDITVCNTLGRGDGHCTTLFYVHAYKQVHK